MAHEVTTFPEYVIFEHGGKQYQGVPSKTIALQKIKGDADDVVAFDKILLRKKGDVVEIGQPYLKLTINASIVKHSRGPKITVFRFKRRKKVRVKRGYRNDETVVRFPESV